MSTMPVISFEPIVVSLATIGADALYRFAGDLATEPRVFGSEAVGRSSIRWCSMVTDPSPLCGVANVVDDELVGIGRLMRRTTAGRELYVAVAAPWRRLGLGTRLVRDARQMAAERGEEVVLVAERPKAPVLALAQRFGLRPVGTVAGFLAYHGRSA